MTSGTTNRQLPNWTPSVHFRSGMLKRGLSTVELVGAAQVSLQEDFQTND